MRFQINYQKLGTLLLAVCVAPAWLHVAPSRAMGQERVALQEPAASALGAAAAAKQGQGQVTTASSVRTGESPSLRTAQLTGVVMLVQPPNDLPATEPPGNSGPTLAESGADNNSQLDSSKVSEGTADAEFSENSLMPLQSRGLNNRVQVVDLSVAGLGTGQIPEGASEQLEVEAAYGRAAAFKSVHWHPSSICHYPLRFEEAMLERHGHVRYGLLQPLASGVRFFATIPMIPYLNTLQPRHQPVYALGNYRPGSAAPMLRDSIPYDAHAAVVEAMAVAGFFWAAPL